MAVKVYWELPREPAVMRAWELATRELPRARVAYDMPRFQTLHATYEREQYPDALGALVAANVAWLAVHPDTPGLFLAGVRYARECAGYEIWRTIPALIEAGTGDCEDLAAARVAELCADGRTARLRLSATGAPSGGRLTYHVTVWTPEGEEDPSAILGMHESPECDPVCAGLRPCPVG